MSPLHDPGDASLSRCIVEVLASRSGCRGLIDVPRHRLLVTEDPTNKAPISASPPIDDPMRPKQRGLDPMTSNEPTEDTEVAEDPRFVDDVDPQLPPETDLPLSSPSSSSFNSRASTIDRDNEDMLAEVDQTVMTKKKRKVAIRPDPPGSTLSDAESLQLLREKCRISEGIALVVPDPTDKADASPPGYFTLYENYFD